MVDTRVPDSGEPGMRLTPQLLFGLFVIVAGLLFLLDNFGVLHADEYTRFWPVALVAIGALKLSQSHRGSGALAGFLFLFVGMWLLLEELAIVRVQFEDIWPLLLVIFGAYLVWQGLSTRTAGPTPTRDAPSTFSAMAILGGVSRGSTSQSFRSADLTAIMGGCEVDLRNAVIDGEAVIDVFALWGGIEIKVPDAWAVDLRVVPLLGGAEDKTRPPQGSTVHRLILRGFAIMGGVEIKN